jgi:hypothetical protein
VGDVDEGDADLLLDALEFDLHILAEFQIQRSQGFVQQQDLGAVHQGPGNGHPLLLPAGEGVRTAALKPLETDDFQHFHDPVPDFGFGNPLRPSPRGGTPLHPQSESDVLKHVQMGKQGVLLEDGVDLPPVGREIIDPHTVKEDVSRHRCRETANNPQRGGFAAPAGP